MYTWSYHRSNGYALRVMSCTYIFTEIVVFSNWSSFIILTPYSQVSISLYNALH